MNTLFATVTAVIASEYLSSIEVVVGIDPFHLLLAERSSEKGLLHTNVTLAFKETEVILSKVFTPTTANIQRAIVHKIDRGVVLSQIILAYQDTELTALVPSLTFDTLGIAEGDDLFWMVQPGEISLLRGPDGI